MPSPIRAWRRALGAALGALALGGALSLAVTLGDAASATGPQDARLNAPQEPPFEPEPEPSEPEPSETTPPPPPPPDPVAGLVVGAADVSVGNGYWLGARERYGLLIALTNAGDAPATVSGAYTLPAGVRKVAASGSGGCDDAGGWLFGCTLAPGASGKVAVQVTVDADAWRRAPLAGSVAATAAVIGRSDITAGDQDQFAVTLPPGPPTPGIALSASDPTVSGTRGEGAELSVVLRNTGAAPATGVVEVVTPTGVQVAAVPTRCVNHVKVSANRERCEIGQLEPGAEAALGFGLSVRGDTRDGPLTGAVHGSLTPPGQDTVSVQASYRIVFNPVAASASPDPSGEPEVASTGLPAAREGPGLGPQQRPVSNLADGVSRQLSVLPIVAAMVGLVAVLGVLVVLSLRRRMQDDIKPPVM